jgi:hypothetical protein
MKRIALLIFLVFLMTALKLSAQEAAFKTNLLYDVTTTINIGYEAALNHKMTLDVWLNYNPWTLGHKWVGIKGAGDMFVEKRETRLKHFMLQPEVRWWACEKFNGHFFGVHIHGGIFDVGAIKMPFGWGDYGLGKYPVEMKTSEGYNVSGVEYEKGTTPYQGLIDKYGEAYAKNQMLYANADRDGMYTNSFDGWFAGVGVSYGYHWILNSRVSMEFTVGLGYTYLKYEKLRCTTCKQALGDENVHYFGPTRAGISLVYMIK